MTREQWEATAAEFERAARGEAWGPARRFKVRTAHRRAFYAGEAAAIRAMLALEDLQNDLGL